MNFIALKMLVGDRAKYLGIVLGLTFASLLITQQAAVFLGIMARVYSFTTDCGLPEIWVVDPKVQFVDDIKPMQDTIVLRVRGVEGVRWAVPCFKGLLQARLANGTFQTCNVVGLDDESLIGGPPTMVAGSLADLRQADGVIVDIVGAQGRLAKKLPDGSRVPLQVGDTLELNDRRAVVVGLCRVSRTFQSNPMLYTTYSRATQYAPSQRKQLSFIFAKTAPGEDVAEVCRRIRKATGFAAYSRDEFKMLTLRYYLRYTGIPINFGTAVLLGFIVGVAIAGQTFHNFTLDNLRYFGTLKAMGATNAMLLRMIVLQSIVVGCVGYGLGVGAASFWGYSMRQTELAFKLPWQLLAISAGVVLFICALTAALSIRKVMKLEPAIVFKS